MIRFLLHSVLPLVLVAVTLIDVATAHDSRPVYVEITEIGEQVRIAWTSPPSVTLQNAPQLGIIGCAAENSMNDVGRLKGAQLFRCKDGLHDQTIEVRYPLYNPSVSTLIRVQFESGEVRSVLLSPEEGRWKIPAGEEFSNIAGGYFKIGVDHILKGYDHILFLAGLIFIAGKPKRILITATGFTVAHSLTIFLVALNLLRVSVPAVELVIAFSIVFLASEIAKNNRNTLTWRRPVLVAGGFGLVHGAGFASALGEIGLPQTEKITALLFFNVGVEAGQVFLIAIALALWATYRRLVGVRVSPAMLQTGFAYVLGGVSAFWLLQRLSTTLL